MFYDGEVKYDSVICKDDYSTCDLSYDISNPEFIEFKGIDKDMNETTLKIRYYNVYQLPQEYEENNINVKTNIKTNNSEGVYSIMSIYTLNKTIRSNNKSLSYSPIIDFYDENFEEVEDVSVYITSDILSNKCINNSNFMLKDEYKYNDVLK